MCLVDMVTSYKCEQNARTVVAVFAKMLSSELQMQMA